MSNESREGSDQMLIWKARYHPLQNIARGGGVGALGPVLMQFWDFSIISLLATVLSLQSFNNSLGDSYIVYLLLDIMFRFTYDE